MVKKSLSWFLAIIMAFTVFGGASLFKADKAYADPVAPNYGYYICKQVECHGAEDGVTFVPINGVKFMKDLAAYNGISGVVDEDEPITGYVGKHSEELYLVEVSFNKPGDTWFAAQKIKTAKWSKNYNFKLHDLQKQKAISDYSIVSADEFKWDITKLQPEDESVEVISAGVGNEGVEVAYKEAGLADLSVEYVDNLKPETCNDVVMFDITKIVLCKEDNNGKLVELATDDGKFTLSLDLTKQAEGDPTDIYPCLKWYNRDAVEEEDILEYVQLNEKFDDITVKYDGDNGFITIATDAEKKCFTVVGSKETDSAVPAVFTFNDSKYYKTFSLATTVSTFDTSKTEGDFEAEDLEVCRVGVNLLTVLDKIADATTIFDEDEQKMIKKVREILNGYLGHGNGVVSYTTVKKMNMDFMDLYEDGLETYLSTNILKGNDRIYAACSTDNDQDANVLINDGSVKWTDNENVEVVTLGELYGDYVEKYLQAELEAYEAEYGECGWYDGRTLFNILEGLGVYEESDVKTLFVGKYITDARSHERIAVYDETNHHIRLTKAMFDKYYDEALNSLDSIAIVLGTNAVDNGEFGFDVTAKGETTSKRIGLSVNEADAINVETSIVNDNSVTVKWDEVEKMTNYFGNDNSYWVYLEEVKDGTPANDTYAFMFRNIISKIEGLVDQLGKVEYSEEYDKYFAKAIDLSDVSKQAYDGGWKAFAMTDKTEVKFQNLEKGKDYRAVVIAFKGTGDKFPIAIDNGESYYYKAAEALKGEIVFTAQKPAVDVKNIEASLNKYETVFNGSEQKPVVTATYGNAKLIEGDDYDVYYGEGDYNKVGKYTITITGKGAYTGTRELCYEIKAASLKAEEVTLDKESVKFTGEEQKPTVKVTFGNAELIKDTDYTVDFGTGDYKAVGTYKITVKGINNYTGTVEKVFTIADPDAIDLSECTLKLAETKFVYDGGMVNVESLVTVLDKDKKEISSDWYTVDPASVKNVGTHVVLVYGDATHAAGVLSDNIVIYPQTTKIKSLKKGTKQFTAKWAVKTSQVDGYQVQYARNSSFTSAKKTKTIYDNTKGKLTVKKLKKNKKYYVKVRTFKECDDGVTYYSAWSTVKSVKTK